MVPLGAVIIKRASPFGIGRIISHTLFSLWSVLLSSLKSS